METLDCRLLSQPVMEMLDCRLISQSVMETLAHRLSAQPAQGSLEHWLSAQLQKQTPLYKLLSHSAEDPKNIYIFRVSCSGYNGNSHYK